MVRGRVSVSVLRDAMPMATGGPHGLHDTREPRGSGTRAPRRGDNALRETPPNLSMRFWLRIDGRYAHVSATREKVRVGSGTRIPSGTTERERDRGRTPGVPYTSRITRHNNGSTRLARRHGGLGPCVVTRSTVSRHRESRCRGCVQAAGCCRGWRGGMFAREPWFSRGSAVREAVGVGPRGVLRECLPHDVARPFLRARHRAVVSGGRGGNEAEAVAEAQPVRLV